jgi:CRP-like cAMP-binding protein
MPVPEATLSRNQLLSGITGEAQAEIRRVGDVVPLEVKQVLFEQGQPIPSVYFPVLGVCSLLSVDEAGAGVEVATVGNEGFVGLPVFLQATLTSAHMAMVQIEGEAIVVESGRFLDLSNSGGSLQAVLGRYTQALITLIAQGVACNRLHDVVQRCARWLLMTHDRVDGASFALTQEFLGQMLGVGRQAVNDAARRLQADGLIEYGRGTITVRDRAGLERTACECYGVIRDEFDRLLPPARR